MGGAEVEGAISGVGLVLGMQNKEEEEEEAEEEKGTKRVTESFYLF